MIFSLQAKLCGRGVRQRPSRFLSKSRKEQESVQINPVKKGLSDCAMLLGSYWTVKWNNCKLYSQQQGH